MIRHALTGGALAAVLTITPAVSATADTTPAPAPQSYLAQRAAVPAAQVAADFDTMAGTRPLLRVPFRCNEGRAVGVGAHVTVSQQIGRVGETGNVTGPHLHYEQIRDGVVVQAKFGTSTWAEYPGPATYSRIRDC